MMMHGDISVVFTSIELSFKQTVSFFKITDGLRISVKTSRMGDQ